MKFEQSPMPSQEEMAKIEKERVLSDAELLKGGAEFKFNEKGDKTFELTDKQIKEKKEEMEKDLESRKKWGKESTEKETSEPKEFKEYLSNLSNEIKIENKAFEKFY